MQITDQLFAAFIRCRYKAHLKIQGQVGIVSEYDQLLSDLDDSYRDNAIRNLRRQFAVGRATDAPAFLPDVVTHGFNFITNTLATHGCHSVTFEALERVTDDGNAGKHRYVPLVFTHRQKITRHDRLLVAFHVLVLSELLGTPPTFGKIVHGRVGAATKVTLANAGGTTEVADDARRLLDELAVQTAGTTTPTLTLNDHCPLCEFRERCHAAAVEKDDISLLRGLSAGEVQALRERGIFTVTQLSYTFRAKSVTGKRPGKSGRHLPALQALAIREKKVYLARLPTLPVAATRVFFDVEGVPDRDFYYLIGAVIEASGQTRTVSFWADGPEDERRIWHDLLDLLAGLGTFTAYHYGRYDRKFLDHMTDRYGVPPGSAPLVERLKAEAVDVLAVISGGVYFPTHSRSLKAIGSFVGVIWSDKAASGLQSLVWRHRWEETREAAMKEALLRYNAEDCMALRMVSEVLDKLAQGTAGATDVVGPDELPANPVHRFGMGSPATPEIGKIIKCAYFDYQTNKVFFRTDAAVRASVRRKKVRSRTPRINSVITCPPPKRCPRCEGERLSVYGKQTYSNVRFDLRFSPSGVRRWVVRYETRRYQCNSCHSTCVSDTYPKHAGRFGHALASWAIQAHVALKQSFADVTSGINDAFGYSFTYPILHVIKPQIAKEYGKTQELLLAKLKASHVLYVDETKVRNGAKKGYVWTFTNL